MKFKPEKHKEDGNFCDSARLRAARGICALLALSVNAFLVLLFMEAISRSDFLQAQAWMVMTPAAAAASWGLMLLFYLTLMLLLGSAARSALAGNTLLILMSCIHHFTYAFKGEPFRFSDLFLISEAAGIVRKYAQDVVVPPYMLAGLVLMIAVVPCALIGLRVRMRALPRAAASLILAAATALGGLGFAHMESGRFTTVPMDDYRFSGFLLAFAHTAPLPGRNMDRMQKPEGYGKEMISSLLSGHEASDEMPQETPDVLFIMSEALYDLSRTGKMELTPDPLSGLYALQQAHWGGTFIAQTYGGGTVLSEYEVLTGYRSGDMWSTPFLNRNTVFPGMETVVTQLEEHGYTTHAIHQGEIGFYDRGYAYDALGFDTKMFLKDMTPTDRSLTGYPSDAHLYEEIIRAYEGRDAQKPWFCHAVTYQNHGPYGEIAGADQFSVAGSLSDAGKATARSYGAAVQVSMDELSKLLAYFEAQERPVMVVLWGDHAPNLSYFGVDMPGDAMQAAAYYETPALIWSNYGLDVRAEIPDMPEMIAGYRIGAYALRLIGIESDAYFNYLSSADAPDLYEVFYGLSAIGGERVMDSERYAQEAAKMAALHYDRLKGKNYGKELRR